MKKLLLFACAAMAFAACSTDDDNQGPVVCPHGTRVSFESDEALTDVNERPIVLADAAFYSNGAVYYTAKTIFWPKPLANEMGQTDDYDQIYWQGPYIYAAGGLVMLGGYYEDGTMWDQAGTKVTDTWGGFTLSQSVDMIASESNMTNQFLVWAAGGANQTKTFAVGYDSNSAGEGWLAPKEYNAPQIDFGRQVSPYQVFLANSTFVYPYFTGKVTDKLAVKITGWIGDTEGKSVTCALVDGAKKVSDWVLVDLSSLGAVDKLTFKVESSDVGAPFYFCLDDLCFD